MTPDHAPEPTDQLLDALRAATTARDAAQAEWDRAVHAAFDALPDRRAEVAQAAGLKRTTLYQHVERHPRPEPPAPPTEQMEPQP